MSIRKRAPSHFLSLKQIHQGEIRAVDEGSSFFLEGDNIPRIRICGVILNRYDNISSNDNPYVSLLLDDSTDTIYLRVWDSTEFESNASKIMEQIKTGDLVDVIGKVRQFNDDKYIVPELISIKESMQWEIHKRAQLLLNQVEREEYAEPEAEAEIKFDDTIKEDAKKILDVMMDNIDENTTEKLAERAKLSFAETKQIIQYLRIEDYIITPRAGKFKKL